MKTLLDLITIEMKAAFRAAGYDEELAKVTLSNRPDLCEYQCNGAMAGAKTYRKAPFMIAEDVEMCIRDRYPVCREKLADCDAEISRDHTAETGDHHKYKHIEPEGTQRHS